MQLCIRVVSYQIKASSSLLEKQLFTYKAKCVSVWILVDVFSQLQSQGNTNMEKTIPRPTDHNKTEGSNSLRSIHIQVPLLCGSRDHVHQAPDRYRRTQTAASCRSSQSCGSERSLCQHPINNTSSIEFKEQAW